jgi:hypothetical protein
MTEASAVTIRRCTFCAKEWAPGDSARLAELCPFRHAHSTGWYRTGHQIDTITISIPDNARPMGERWAVHDLKDGPPGYDASSGCWLAALPAPWLGVRPRSGTSLISRTPGR